MRRGFREGRQGTREHPRAVHANTDVALLDAIEPRHSLALFGHGYLPYRCVQGRLREGSCVQGRPVRGPPTHPFFFVVPSVGDARVAHPHLHDIRARSAAVWSGRAVLTPCSRSPACTLGQEMSAMERNGRVWLTLQTAQLYPSRVDNASSDADSVSRRDVSSFGPGTAVRSAAHTQHLSGLHTPSAGGGNAEGVVAKRTALVTVSFCLPTLIFVRGSDSAETLTPSSIAVKTGALADASAVAPAA